MAEDAVLEIPSPILFAHRGGAKEAPESTKAAFRYAKGHYANVLELDVQVTADKKIVVWHGPKLDNVKIEGQSNFKIIRIIKGKSKIWDYTWETELNKRAWVAHPEKGEKLDEVPRDDERLLLLLEEFLDFLNKDLDKEQEIPLNIELKGKKIPIVGKNKFIEDDNELLKKFKAILDSKGGYRNIIVASTSEKVLFQFDKINRNPSYPTNVSVCEQLGYSKHMNSWFIKHLPGFLKNWMKRKRTHKNLENIAFETSYQLVSKELVEKVKREKGSIYVFLTPSALGKGLIEKLGNNDSALSSAIHDVLNTGVDGIMTDYPNKVGEIVKRWKEIF